MSTLPASLYRPELDPLWPRLRENERRAVSIWAEIKRRMDVADDKTAALVMVFRDFAGQVRSLTRSSVYRITRGLDTVGLEAVIGKAAVRRARGIRGGQGLPPAFVSFWRSLCGDHQRRKALSAWRHLMLDELIAGKIIPGYRTDWRGIFAAENPDVPVPEFCPYSAIHQGAGAFAPRGWSYSSLLALAPEKDVWAGASIGVHAMRAFNPVVPHTRVGLRPMSVITMDDVKLDVLCWYPGEKEPRRPVGLGVMDVLTGNIIDFTLVPAQEREDGTVSGLQGFWARYVWANLFCGIGVDPTNGVIALLEHGSAGLSEDEAKRINDILGRRDDNGMWLTVERSSTSGAPLLKGLFQERGRGRPTHKAMLEATWNLLHNELAMLNAPSGKDWDNAPQGTGWTSEDKALIKAASEILAQGCPEAIEILHQAQTYAQSYDQLNKAVGRAIAVMNTRKDHNIKDWVECGFVNHVVEMGGSVVPLSEAARSFAGDDPDLREMFLAKMGPKARGVKMSPLEAWNSRGGGKGLKRFSPFVATRILGPELAQRVTVTAEGQFKAKDHFSGKGLLYSGIIRQEDGTLLHLGKGETIDVWVNPVRIDWALVCKPDGVFLGLAKYMAPTVFGNQVKSGNLGELALARSEQKARTNVVAGARLMRETERRADNARVLARAAAAPSRAAQSQFEDLAGEGPVELGDL